MYNTQHNPVLYNKNSPFGSFINWDGRIRTSEMAGPKPAALPLGDVPLLSTIIIKYQD